MEENIVLIDDLSIRDKIHTIRGVKVMLDFDLAEIYGYTTSRFNEQVSNNANKFEGDDFSFILTDKEFTNLMSKKSISSWGGRRKKPRAFTEQGIYMLMTVLRGELAVRQSRALIRTFRAMKDYIVAGRSIAGRHELLQDASSNRKNSNFFPES